MKWSLGRCRWGNNIKMDLKEVEWKGGDWSHLWKDRVSWRVLVNGVIGIPFARNGRVSAIHEEVLTAEAVF
jgi:hypothetical protein